MQDKFHEALDLAIAGRLEEAINIFEEILLDSPRNPDVLHNLGMCFTEADRPEKAVKALEPSIEYNPLHLNSKDISTSIMLTVGANRTDNG